MWSSSEYLEVCKDLHSAGLPLRWEEGQRIGRGYADVGVEEFLLLPGRKLLSLSSGTSSSIVEGHSHFFFWIPSLDECIEEIDRRGWDIQAAIYVERRMWRVTATCGSDAVEVLDASLEQSFILLLRAVIRRRTG